MNQIAIHCNVWGWKREKMCYNQKEDLERLIFICNDSLCCHPSIGCFRADL